MTLTLRQAEAILDAGEARARALGVSVNIAILDGGAHLKAFRRMDGAVLGSIDVANRKAATAVLFNARSEAIWDYCKPGAAAPGLELSNGGLAPFGGGIPLNDQKTGLVGAVDISGGSVVQDLEIAEAAAAAFPAEQGGRT